MNVKMLRPLAAALVLASSHSAIAETLGEHPAVIVARTWSTRGIDPNTLIMRHPAVIVANPTSFIVPNPASSRLPAVSPAAKDKATRVQAPSGANAVSASN